MHKQEVIGSESWIERGKRPIFLSSSVPQACPQMGLGSNIYFLELEEIPGSEIHVAHGDGMAQIKP